VLIARKDPRRHPRVAARWLLRFLEKSTGWRKRLPEKLSPKGGPEYVGKLKAVSRRYVALITAGDRSIDDGLWAAAQLPAIRVTSGSNALA
jgi:hypothetical protein